MRLHELQYAEPLRKRQDGRTRQQNTIAAQLIGSHQCEARGIVAKGYAPALVLCRELLAAGANPDAALAVYRNGVLSLRVRSIREGAQFAVEDSETGTPRFRLARPSRRGEPLLVRPRPDFDQNDTGRP
jgi:hypothetical protein